MYRLGLIADILNASRTYAKYGYWRQENLKTHLDSGDYIDRILVAFSHLRTECIEHLRDACVDRGFIPNYIFGAMGCVTESNRVLEALTVLLRYLS